MVRSVAEPFNPGPDRARRRGRGGARELPAGIPGGLVERFDAVKSGLGSENDQTLEGSFSFIEADFCNQIVIF